MKVDRCEKKYILSKEQSLLLKNQLMRVLSPDFHSLNGSYNVRSLYFDSLENIDFHEKLDGIQNRKKIRLRIYDRNPNVIKLEVKEKEGDYQKKQTLFLSQKEADEIILKNYNILLRREEDLAKQLYIIMTQGAYHPSVIVEYERRAFVHPDFNTRITFDENVRESEFVSGFFTRELPAFPVYRDNVVLEVKYTDFLIGAVQILLEQYQPFQVSVSKYAMSRGGA